MRFVLVVVLAVLSPWVAEFVAFGTADRLWLLVFLAPMYGAGAVLIREIARRGHRPWAVIALLGAAYGIAEACLIDMSLFNPNFEGTKDYTEPAHIPIVGTSASNALVFIVGHVVWSIAAPIALTEALAGTHWRGRPWLRRPGLAACVVIYLAGAALIHADVADGFTPSGVQIAAALALIGLCVSLAIVFGRRSPHLSAAPVSLSPWVVGALAFVTASGWCLLPATWAGAAGAVALLFAAAATLGWASRHMNWGAAHTLAAAAGAICTYLWVAVTYPVADYPGDHANPAFEHQSEVIFTVAAIALVVLGARRLRAPSQSVTAQATS